MNLTKYSSVSESGLKKQLPLGSWNQIAHLFELKYSGDFSASGYRETKYQLLL